MATRRRTKRSDLKLAATSPADAGTPKQSQSVRFSPEERELINQAALKLGISISRFVQDAAVGRAVDVLNARAAETRLLGLAQEVVQWIVNPDVTVSGFEVAEDTEKIVQTLPSRRLHELRKTFYTPADLGFVVDNIAVESPSTEKLTELRLALETARTEFANHLIDQLRTYATNHDVYRPTHAHPSMTEPLPEAG